MGIVVGDDAAPKPPSVAGAYKGGRPRRLDDARIAALHAAGKTHAQIAAEVGCSYQGVRLVLGRKGLLRNSTRHKGTRPHAFDHDAARAAYAGGATVSAIAKAAGVAPGSVARVVRKGVL